jgi:tetratricopeptide (TPR) repeat protein
MSLLMQALKKAEQAKKKQNDLPIIEEHVEPKSSLTLDEQHSHISIDVNNNKKKIEPMMEPLVEKVSEKNSEQNSEKISTPSFKSSFAELSLTPQQEEVSLENELSALDDNKQEIQSKGMNVDFESQTPENVVHSNDDVTSHAEKEELKSSPRASFTNDAELPSKVVKEEEEQDISQKNFSRPHIDTEKKQLKNQENASQLIDQKKAQAVFSSKTPQNKLKSRWVAIVLIVLLFSLLGVGYIYWQQSNNIRNQFPVSAPINVEQAPLSETIQSVPLIKVEEERASVLVQNLKESEFKNIESNKKDVSKLLKPSIAENNNVEKKNTNFKVKESVVAEGKKIEETSTVAIAQKAPSKSINKANEIQISKGSSGAKINPKLHEAYQAYIAGNSQTATLQYQKVLQQEPNNRDALLGLAAIALNSRQAEQAGAYYGQLLTLDPNDPDAIAGLTSLQQGDPVQSESRLKSALNQHPNAGPILFALGNVYAQQSRWSDAQQTYFRAYTTTPNNADYAFNLAISLDRLSQRKLAIEYYQRAVVLGKSGNVNFNLVKAQQRLTELENIRDK